MRKILFRESFELAWVEFQVLLNNYRADLSHFDLQSLRDPYLIPTLLTNVRSEITVESLEFRIQPSLVGTAVEYTFPRFPYSIHWFFV